MRGTNPSMVEWFKGLYVKGKQVSDLKRSRKLVMLSRYQTIRAGMLYLKSSSRRMLWQTELLTFPQKTHPLSNNLSFKKFPDIEYLSALISLFLP